MGMPSGPQACSAATGTDRACLAEPVAALTTLNTALLTARNHALTAGAEIVLSAVPANTLRILGIGGTGSGTLTTH
ncbi:hypothetical protein [Streptomyces sp. Ru73]|uniref:hypothetical protein n=1 Tax=Streptomyces sp. Ru73 TaxID=2080748 RepID=UPI0011B0630A|nr:hypothetical protein [Streptomyces sp. Ru73]